MNLSEIQEIKIAFDDNFINYIPIKIFENIVPALRDLYTDKEHVFKCLKHYLGKHFNDNEIEKMIHKLNEYYYYTSMTIGYNCSMGKK